MKEIQTTHPTPTINNQAKRNIKNCRYKKPNFPITNLSNHQLSKDEMNLLSKGLNFIPTPRRDHPAKMLQDILLFDRRIRLKYHFIDTANQTQGPQQPTSKHILQPQLRLDPPSG